jgi:hypothetical protein
VCGKNCYVTSWDAWKARIERYVAFNGNYFEGKNTDKIIWLKIYFLETTQVTSQP